MMAKAYTEILRTYEGSNGEATLALYADLKAHGAAGHIAVNVFRAMKASERAKVYRGGAPGKGSYKRMAYERKQWAIDNLVKALSDRAADLGIGWGWGRDTATIGFEWLLYIELPTGQVSFHCATRGEGPDFQARWDGILRAAPCRIARWCEQVLEGVAA